MQRSSPRAIARGERASVLLTAYPRRWGHMLVVAHDHVTTFAEMPDATWEEMGRLSLRAARALERALSPARCYVASLGCSRDDAVASSPHVHMHVLPVFDESDTPGSVLSWEGGVLSGSPSEWDELVEALARAFSKARE